MNEINAKAEYLEACGLIIQAMKADIARRQRKCDVLQAHLAEAMRGIDEFISPEVVIVSKDFTRRRLSPTKRRDLRRKHGYLWEGNRGR